ncbi:hypothetical protein [Gorillibacterium sp. sgz500922]|uniref:hypothetical protein n=1 Tax=Gorillibacterium sp. sgz500922 TaxID=3446694 RepID=UPI003F6775BB
MTLYRLYRYEFGRMLPLVLGLATATLVLTPWLVRGQTKGWNPYSLLTRYEAVLAASGATNLFFLLFVVLLAGFLVQVYREYFRSKGVYTWMTLPADRSALYFGKLLALITAALVLLAAELLAVRLGYGTFSDRMRQAAEREPMTNGLYLAFIRSDYLRLLLPLTPSRILSSAALFFVLLTGVYYAALCERSREWKGLAAVIAVLLYGLRLLSYRLAESGPAHQYQPRTLYSSSLLLILLAAGFVAHSIWLIKKGAIA